jgi:integron integrase
MSRPSEEAYVGWIRRFILANGKRHPARLGAPEIERFLTALAVHGRVAAATQNQALSALLFLYKQVLGVELPWLDGIERAKRPQRLPVVLTRAEVTALLGELTGLHWLMGSLLYGTGMRLMECVRLRVKDVDFERGEILVRQGKGAKDRRTMLPRAVREPLQAQLSEAARVHRRDIAAGFGRVWMPDALARKFPSAAQDWGWQYVFPSAVRSVDPRDGVERRHHVDESRLQRAIKAARDRAGNVKPATCHTWRHSFATHLLEAGQDRFAGSESGQLKSWARASRGQSPMDGANTPAPSRSCSATRMWPRQPLLRIPALAALAHPCAAQIYTHVLNRGGHGVLSPLDR